MDIHEIISRATPDTVSLDKIVYDDFKLSDVIPSKENIEEDILKKELQKYIRAILKKELTPREAKILKLRYLSEEEYTLEEVGKIYGLTRERIRQIELKAKRKIKKHLIQYLKHQITNETNKNYN